MNREDIIRMAQETGVTAERVRDLVNFAALVASAEREVCAKVCEKVAVDYYTRIGGEHEPYMKATAEDCAAALREALAQSEDEQATIDEVLQLIKELRPAVLPLEGMGRGKATQEWFDILVKHIEEMKK